MISWNHDRPLASGTKPSQVVSASGNEMAIVVWVSNGSLESYYCDGSGRWTLLSTITAPGCNLKNPQVSLQGKFATLYWEQNSVAETTLYTFYYATFDPSQGYYWTSYPAPTAITENVITAFPSSPYISNTNSLQVVANSAGDEIGGWINVGSGDPIIGAGNYTDSTNRSAIVCASKGIAATSLYFPNAAIDQDGNGVLTWGANNRTALYASFFTEQTNSWSRVPLTITTTGVQVTSAHAAIATTSAGSTVVTMWATQTSTSENYTLYGAATDLTSSTFGATCFTCALTSPLDPNIQVASDSQGNVIATWLSTTLKSGEPVGTLMWVKWDQSAGWSSSTGTDISSTQGHTPLLAVSDAGNVIVTSVNAANTEVFAWTLSSTLSQATTDSTWTMQTFGSLAGVGNPSASISDTIATIAWTDNTGVSAVTGSISPNS